MSDNWTARRIRTAVIGKGIKFNGSWEGETDVGSDPSVHNITLDQIITISKEKAQDLSGKGVKQRSLEVMGTCVSMRCHIEGIVPKDFIKQVKAGDHDDKFN